MLQPQRIKLSELSEGHTFHDRVIHGQLPLVIDFTDALWKRLPPRLRPSADGSDKGRARAALPCYDWCVHPCEELQGDFHHECGGCGSATDTRHYECQPGWSSGTDESGTEGSVQPGAPPALDNAASLLSDLARSGTGTFRDGGRMLGPSQMISNYAANESLYVFGYRVSQADTARYREYVAPLVSPLPPLQRFSDDGQFFLASGRVDSELHYDPEGNANMHIVLHGAKHLTLWRHSAAGEERPRGSWFAA